MQYMARRVLDRDETLALAPNLDPWLAAQGLGTASYGLRQANEAKFLGPTSCEACDKPQPAGHPVEPWAAPPEERARSD
jgi:hypothetical protein